MHNLLAGKKGIIMGIANNRSIASSIAQCFEREGATIGYSFLPDNTGKMEGRIRKALEGQNIDFLEPCDVTNDAMLSDFFTKAQKHFGKIDFLIHSIAYAPLDELRKNTLEASRQGFLQSMDASVYSFIATAKQASAIMNPEGSIITLSYYGAEKVVEGYNLMGLAKAALECAVRYAAFELGPNNIRVNSISAGAIKTLASSAIGNFNSMLDWSAKVAPLKRTVRSEEVANAALFLTSHLASGLTGENIHVDCGYSSVSTIRV